MIRVNLLPQKRTGRGAGAAGPQQSQKWLLAVLGVLVVEIVLLFLFHQTKVEELDEQAKRNQQIQSQIEDIKKLVASHEEVKKALAVLRAREDAIAKLQSGRAGPTAVLLEISQLLTPGRGPTIDKDVYEQKKKENPLSVYNPGWDSRRLWLQSYVESERTVRMEGLARDASDVYEVAQRFKLSPYFYDVQLLPGRKQAGQASAMELATFALQMKVRY